MGYPDPMVTFSPSDLGTACARESARAGGFARKARRPLLSVRPRQPACLV
jgi:hypothetical protein